MRGFASDRRGWGWSVLSGAVRLSAMAATVTVGDLLGRHVSLDIECLDRVYLNGYVPTLQVGGPVVSFMREHLGNPIQSPVILEKIGTAFRRSVSRFAEDEHIPVVRFAKADRKIDVMRRHLARQEATGRSGVAAIVVAPEFQNVFVANQRQAANGTRRHVAAAARTERNGQVGPGGRNGLPAGSDRCGCRRRQRPCATDEDPSYVIWQTVFWLWRNTQSGACRR